MFGDTANAHSRPAHKKRRPVSRAALRQRHHQQMSLLLLPFHTGFHETIHVVPGLLILYARIEPTLASKRLAFCELVRVGLLGIIFRIGLLRMSSCRYPESKHSRRNQSYHLPASLCVSTPAKASPANTVVAGLIPSKITGQCDLSPKSCETKPKNTESDRDNMVGPGFGPKLLNVGARQQTI
jgi:hypothetical protein